MRIGIPRELKPREGRVGLIPAACVELVRGGHEVFVEHGAGEKSGYSDQHFRDVGVTVLPSADELFDKSQMIVKVKEPIEPDLKRLRKDHLLFCYLHLAALARAHAPAVSTSVSPRWRSKPSKTARAACRCSLP